MFENSKCHCDLNMPRNFVPSRQALTYPSGLFVLTFGILTFAKGGSHILIQDNSYCPVGRFVESELPQKGVHVIIQRRV